MALQGDFAAHERALTRNGYKTHLLRGTRDFDTELSGLVLPGGESSAMLRLLDRFALWDRLAALRGIPTLATCAGLILLACQVVPDQRSLGWLDVTVARNGYGRQLDSFEAVVNGRSLVFIRAPRLTRIGERAETLMHYGDDAVLVRQAGVVAASFHAELGADPWLIDLAFGREAVGLVRRAR